MVEYKIKLHKAQSKVLNILLYATRARFSELRKPTGLESDIFKYHLRRLVNAKFIVKAEDGQYELTAEGKEFANRLDESTGREIEQPKSSMLMVVRCGNYILAHRRDREPFNGFWGIASAPVLRGLPLVESASRALMKQAGIEASFRVAGSYRVIDVNQRDIVLEDKIFALMVADIDRLVQPHKWSGGYSEWIPLEELLSRKPLFPITSAVFEMLSAGVAFREDKCIYRSDQY